MTRKEAVDHINGLGGKIFSIRFRKRTDSKEIREMLCRKGVKKGLVKEEDRIKPGIDFAGNKLIPVWDIKKGGYRSIPIEGIISIKINGKWVEVKD